MSKQKPEAKKIGRVKSAVINWLGIPVGLDNAEFMRALSAQSEVAGQTVNQDTVMSLSAAWACVRLISETVGTLPLKIYERTPDGRKLAPNHPMANMLQKRPNSESTANQFWQAMTAAMLLQGNGIAIRLRVGARVVGLEFLQWEKINLKQDNYGDYQFWRILRDGTQVRIPRDDIFRIAGFSLDGVWGVSAISYGASVFGSALAASDTANNTFEKGLSPKVYFKTEKTIQKEQREEFRKNLAKIGGSLNAGESPLLEGGMDAKAIGINPKDAQLLESRGFSVEEVCRWFGVDPSLVGHGQAVSNFGTGLEQKMIAFLTFTLRPWLTRIEQSINAFLLPVADNDKYYVEFSLEGLLRGDSKSRAEFLRIMVDAGIMDRDEARAKENLQPKGGNATKLMTNGATQPIDTLGE